MDGGRGERGRTVAGDDADHLLGLDGLFRGSEEKLWRRHLQMGIASFVLGALLLLAYLALTPHGPHRQLIIVIDLVVVALSLFVVGPVGSKSLTADWRDEFFFAWSVATLGVIAIAVALDNGVGSPLAPYLVLPVMFGGLRYHLREVAGLSALALLTFGLIYLTGPSASGARAIATAVLIGIVGSISATAAINREIADDERRVLTEHLHRLAVHDGLTGCLNYQSFQAALAHEIERAARHRCDLSVVIADLDGFKTVNDRFGHAVGDSTLCSIASALQSGVRSLDLVGRIGGDEFAILLPETGTEEAGQVVERLQAGVGALSTPGPLTLSFGLSTWQGIGDSAKELIRRADTALYEAKQQGRNRLVVLGVTTDPMAGPSLPADVASSGFPG